MKITKLVCVAFLILGLNVIFFNMASAMDQDNMIEEKIIIEIAENEAVKLGYDLKEMGMNMSFHETPWNEYFPEDCHCDYCSLRKDILKNKRYWAVYFYPLSLNIRGGDVCFFIDASGVLLTTYRGK